jgi:transcriptional regulator of arginine metabolism
MNKNYRQGQIVKLIHSRQVHTQEDLAKALRAIGVPATQVTLSRDIRELGLIKTPEGYAQAAESAPAAPDLATLIRDYVLDIRLAQNLLVLRTPPGHANSLGVALDRAEWSEITGTIAGDDTVLVVTPDAKTAEATRATFLRMLR